jgi:predicted GNAT family acetyltransferase
MHPPTRSEETEAAAVASLLSAGAPDSLSIHPLTDRDEAEVLAFLAERPLHTVVMAGHIRDNGLESAFNRGVFHACRNGAGRLEGVALIGHATLVETRSEASLAAFARLAQGRPEAHLIMGEQEKIERFWRYYASVGQRPRRVCREMLLEQRWPVEAHAPVEGLRPATISDLEPVMRIQGEMAHAESGINPLEADPTGFRVRCARRIEQGRVWVWAEGERLIFKADVISDTPQVVYLEGVHVDPEERGKGYGTRCLSQLGQTLLARTGSLCVLVNERGLRARAFFERAGYKLRGCYDTVFLGRQRAANDFS